MEHKNPSKTAQLKEKGAINLTKRPNSVINKLFLLIATAALIPATLSQKEPKCTPEKCGHCKFYQEGIACDLCVNSVIKAGEKHLAECQGDSTGITNCVTTILINKRPVCGSCLPGYVKTANNLTCLASTQNCFSGTHLTAQGHNRESCQTCFPGKKIKAICSDAAVAASQCTTTATRIRYKTCVDGGRNEYGTESYRPNGFKLADDTFDMIPETCKVGFVRSYETGLCKKKNETMFRTDCIGQIEPKESGCVFCDYRSGHWAIGVFEDFPILNLCFGAVVSAFASVFVLFGGLVWEER